MNYGVALAALADPTRRRIYERIRRRPHTVGELARLAKVSQPAASQHLRVLRNARLVQDQRAGTRRYYRATPQGLGGLRRWIESMGDDLPTGYAGGGASGKERNRTRPSPR